MMNNCDRKIKWLMGGVISLFFVYVVLFLYHIHQACPANDLEQYAILKESLKTASNESKDSLIALYLAKIDTLTHEAISKVEFYETSVDLMIDKANNWIGFWVGVLSFLLTISTILQVWRNYQSKVNFEERLKKIEEERKENEEKLRKEYEKKRHEVERLKSELSQTIKEHHIISLANCLSSCPDSVILSQSDKHRKYAKFYLRQLYKEFEEYAKLIKVSMTERNDDRSYLLTKEDYIVESNRVVSILHTISSNITKVQVLFVDVEKSVELFELTRSLTNCSEKLMVKGMSREDLIDNFDSICNKFHNWVKLMED